MGQRRRDRLQILPDRLRTAGQVDDEGALADGGGASRQHAPGRDPHGIGPHGFRNAGEQIVLINDDYGKMIEGILQDEIP